MTADNDLLGSPAIEADRRRKPAEEEESGRRGMDPELLDLGRMLRILEGMEPAARARSVRYLMSRYADCITDPRD